MGTITYDIIIIGGGPAGMTAALYAGRSNLKVLLLDAQILGGQMNNTDKIENYPGYNAIGGQELSEKMSEPIENMQNVTIEYFEKVTSVSKNEDFTVSTDAKEYIGKTVIVASGAHHNELGIPGERDFQNKGVSYCAVCDGAFFNGKHVFVIGGGDSALEEADYLTQFASQVTIIHRRNEFRAKPEIQDLVRNNPKIDFIMNAQVSKMKGEKTLNTLVVNGKDVSADGCFIYVGITPNTEFLPESLLKDKWVKTNEQMETEIPGLYAIGDVRNKELRQVTTAVGDGAIAAQKAYQYLSLNHSK